MATRKKDEQSHNDDQSDFFKRDCPIRRHCPDCKKENLIKTKMENNVLFVNSGCPSCQKIMRCRVVGRLGAKDIVTIFTNDYAPEFEFEIKGLNLPKFQAKKTEKNEEED